MSDTSLSNYFILKSCYAMCMCVSWCTHKYSYDLEFNLNNSIVSQKVQIFIPLCKKNANYSLLNCIYLLYSFLAKGIPQSVTGITLIKNRTSS